MVDVNPEAQKNMVMFSADLAMNIQVLCFVNKLNLVEYSTRAFKAKKDELGNLSVVAPCEGYIKIVYNKKIWTMDWLLMFGNLKNEVTVTAIIEDESKKVELLSPDGYKANINEDNRLSLTISVEGSEDAKNLALQLMTWVMTKIGKITTN